MLKLLSWSFSPRGLLLWGSEAVLIMTVMWAALAWQGAFLGVSIDNRSAVAIAVAVLCQVSLYAHDLYVRPRTNPTRESFIGIIQSIGVAALVVVGVNVLVPGWRIAGGTIVAALGLLPFALMLWRVAYAKLLDDRAFDRKVCLVGVGRLAEDLVATLNAEPDIPYDIAARLPDFEAPRSKLRGVFEAQGGKGVRFSFGSLNPQRAAGNALAMHFQHGANAAPPGGGRRASDPSLLAFVRQARIDHVVVALDDSRGKLPFDDLLRCKFSGVRIEDGLSFYERIAGRVHLNALKPSWLIFSDGFRRPLTTTLFKRFLDVVGSLVGLTLVFPLSLVIAIMIKLDTAGPILYRQKRVGEGGRLFTLLKFRSMCQNAESITGPVWATDRDHRITRVGKWLRTFRFDELPQMINVLRGEMSFVGPRPERPCFVEELKNTIPYYGLRHTVKPGITGWAQVRFRYGSNVHDTMEKLQYDLYYIKNLSVVLDATILLQTIRTVLMGRGAR